MFSDPAYGRTFFREPLDVRTGERRKNSYIGHQIPDEVIQRERVQGTLEERLAKFNPELYLQANPDVRNAGVDPREHFIQFGFSEGRPLAPQ